MSTVIEVSGLTKYYGTKRGVIDLSFAVADGEVFGCLLYTSPSPRDRQKSRMPSSA